MGQNAEFSSKKNTLNSQDFGKRIAALRETLGMSQNGFARHLGLALSSVQNYEKGKLPNGEGLIKIAKTLGCSADFLLFGNRWEDDQKHGHPRADLKERLVLVSKVRAKLNAEGNLIANDEFAGRFAFRNDWLSAKGDPNKMVLMDFFGESMEPAIRDGDTVLIDQSQVETIIGRIYAVSIDEEVMVKYVEKKPGKLVLRSANQQWGDIEVDTGEDQAESVKIIGRVIWWCREAR